MAFCDFVAGGIPAAEFVNLPGGMTFINLRPLFYTPRRIPPARPSTGRTIGRASERRSRQHLEASFFEAWGSFLEPLGTILGALGGHLGGLWGPLGDFLGGLETETAFLPPDPNSTAPF